MVRFVTMDSDYNAVHAVQIFSCIDGYYLQFGSCVQCHDGCSTCTNSTACTTCVDTRWNLNYDCQLECSTTCTESTCDDTTGYCDSCLSGKYGPECGEDCNLCRDGQCGLRKCTHGCKDGYYQDINDAGYSYCWECPDNCITCSNGTYCTQCEPEFYRNYYRVHTGRGQTTCLQCYISCLDCSSTEHCHEDCIQQCSDPVNHGITKSIQETTRFSSTTAKRTPTPFAPLTTTKSTTRSSNTHPNQPDSSGLNTMKTITVTSTKQPNEPHADSSVQKADDNSSAIIGSAVGGGAVVVIAIVFVLLVCFIKRRKTNLPNHCFGRPDDHGDGRHGYVNTIMTDILSVASSDHNKSMESKLPEQYLGCTGDQSNEGREYVNTTMTDIVSVTSSDHIEVHNDNHAVSRASIDSGVINNYQNIESSREYVSLGERSTQESDYTGNIFY
ncbi:hypothetical protein ACF0H5_014609 [Mactra antiquata]